MSAGDVIIIGAGPAGIAAAVQLKRSGLNPIVFEKGKIGGLLNNANLVENYPGFPGGISGVDLVSLFKEQLDSFDIEIISEQVTSLDFENGLFTVQSSGGEKQSKAIIIATGTRPKKADEFKISDNISNKVFYDVTDLLDLEDQVISIIGAGDAAFDYALNLADKNNVTILNRGNNFKCLPLLYERARAVNTINYKTQIYVKKIIESSTTQLILKCSNNYEDIDIISDYVILAVGREIQLDFITENLARKRAELEKKEILHFTGDVNGKIYRQTSIAVGEGVLAAMKIERKYRNKTI